MQNLDAKLTIMLQRVQLVSHPELDRLDKQEVGNKNEIYQLLWNTKHLQSNIPYTCPTEANLVL